MISSEFCFSELQKMTEEKNSWDKLILEAFIFRILKTDKSD